MVLSAALLGVLAGAAVAAAPAVAVAIPDGESAADWSGLAESVGFALGEAPGCPGVVISGEGPEWRVEVCRAGGERRALMLPAGDSAAARDEALMNAARLLHGLGVVAGEFAVAPPSPDAAGPESSAGALVAAIAAAPRRREQTVTAIGPAVSEPTAGIAPPLAVEGAADWLAPAVAPTDARSPGSPWLSLGVGGRVRDAALGAGAVALSLGWGWPGGAQLGVGGELTGSHGLTLPALDGLDSAIRERTLSASVGYLRGPLVASAATGWARWDVLQGESLNATISILWGEASLHAALTRAGGLAVGPELRLRYDYRGGVVTLDGVPQQLMPPTALTIGLKGRLSPPG